MGEIKNKPNSVLDATKFILSFFVVAIHASLWPDALYPWLRIAVPLFFMMSAYLLFGKIELLPESEKRKQIDKYIFRNLKLYAFYFVLLLPLTVYVRGWYRYGFAKGVLLFFRDALFHSTFRASWYIMSSVIALIIIFYLLKKLSNKTVLTLCSLMYLVIVLRSSYMWLLPDSSPIVKAFNMYDTVFTPAFESFPVAVFWMALGKAFAERKREKEKHIKIRICLLTAFFAAALYAEWLFVCRNGGGNNNDCYLMLAPFCILLFDMIISIPERYFACGVTLRRLSTVIYALHASMLMVVTYVLRLFGLNSDMVSFSVTVIICIAFGLIAFKLENKPKLNWLKYSH